jgi:hypothetical protein
MIELIFVIVIMGIIGKFGVEFLARAYKSFFITTLQNRLQQQSEAAVTQIATRLQYRIKNSIVMSTGANKLEWVGYDIDGLRGHWDVNKSANLPLWSGFIDINSTFIPSTTFLSTPESNTTAIDNTIQALSGNTKTIADAAIFFVGASNPTNTIWDGAVADQAGELAHPITSSGTSGFAPHVDDFSNVDIYEFYKLAWSAYTVELNTTSNKLILYYNYQPWNGNTANDGNSSILMENIDSFNYQTIGDLIKIQVCVHGDNIGENISVCKEKTIF